MKKIITALSWLFKDFAYGLYDKSERLFTLSVAPAFPSAATLKYFDNSNNVAAPQGVNVPFNSESQDVWLGWDSATCQLCVTNFDRTTIICCFAGIFPQNT